MGGYVGIPHLRAGELHRKFLAPVFGPEIPVKAALNFDIVSAAWASGGAGHDGSLELALMVASALIALLGITIAYVFYVQNPGLPGRFAASFSCLYHWVHNKYFVDELYDLLFVRGTLKAGDFLLKVMDDWMIEGLVNGTADWVKREGSRLRKVETSYVQE